MLTHKCKGVCGFGRAPSDSPYLMISTFFLKWKVRSAECLVGVERGKCAELRSARSHAE